MKRETFGSKIGFIFAVTGSAVGLANIWRFPVLVGENGGAGFVFSYLFFLFLIGFPVMLSEILLGRWSQKSPVGAFRHFGNAWGAHLGKLSLVTGFFVSLFYSCVAGWIFGYFVESLRGSLFFSQPSDAITHFHVLLANPWFTAISQMMFLSCSTLVLFFGVREGIEESSKFFMPMLVLILFLLIFYGLGLPHANEAMAFLWQPNLKVFSTQGILASLGQAFFTLSLGQGTMITYGSYLKDQEKIVPSCLPVVIMDTCISLGAAIAVFTIVFAVGLPVQGGEGLLFHTIPFVFSSLPFGYVLCPLFFFLVFIAALTSQISVMEPLIAYCIDEWECSRRRAVMWIFCLLVLFGVPLSLCVNVFSSFTVYGENLLTRLIQVTSMCLIPLGGLASVLLVGHGVPYSQVEKEVQRGVGKVWRDNGIVSWAFWFCLKYLAPGLIVLIILQAIL